MGRLKEILKRQDAKEEIFKKWDGPKDTNIGKVRQNTNRLLSTIEFLRGTEIFDYF